jgi:hypothetical protein
VAINGTQRRSPRLGGCTHLMRDAISGHQRHSEALAGLGRVHALLAFLHAVRGNRGQSRALKGTRMAIKGNRGHSRQSRAIEARVHIRLVVMHEVHHHPAL